MNEPAVVIRTYVIAMDPFRGSSDQIEKIQRRLTWPLRKDAFFFRAALPRCTLALQGMPLEHSGQAAISQGYVYFHYRYCY